MMFAVKFSVSLIIDDNSLLFVSKFLMDLLRKTDSSSYSSSYPEHVISKSIFNAKLQGPAPNPDRSKNVISFVTTYYPKSTTNP